MHYIGTLVLKYIKIYMSCKQTSSWYKFGGLNVLNASDGNLSTNRTTQQTKHEGKMYVSNVLLGSGCQLCSRYRKSLFWTTPESIKVFNHMWIKF